MKEVNWPVLYDEVLRSLPEYVNQARLTIGGLATCTDAYVCLNDQTANLLIEPGSPQYQLGHELFSRVSNGLGGELRLDWPNGAAWIADNLCIKRFELGGTAAQAAKALSILGAPALVSLGDRSERQLSVLHKDTLVATPAGVTRSTLLQPRPEQKTPHFIFEFTAGKRLGPCVPKRSTRVIVRLADDPLDSDPDFYRESVRLAPQAGAAIVCGFNELPPDQLESALCYGKNIIDAWKEQGLQLVHLELGDYPDIASRDRTLAVLGSSVTSLGMSLSECRNLGVPGICDPVERALALSHEFDLERVVIHADGWALAAAKSDPERELEALICGCLLASCRAELGVPCKPKRVAKNGAFELTREPIEFIRDRAVVCCAAPYLSTPAATIGLGDTFLAGTLLVLGSRANARDLFSM
ncbi:MAG: hypothetical protein JOY96_08995 [Verrucomicrobia bacterium]|nr:hypothetical protein [Verrucomicrobiota bacterium]